MKRNVTRFLQIVVVLLGIGVFIFMLWEPHLEGRNVDATLFQIYFNDPFLAYVYMASIAFFVGLYQTFKLIGNIGKGGPHLQLVLKALRTIKYCGLILITFILGAEGYLFLVQRKIEEDIAGGVMMGAILILISAIVATTTTIFERKMRKMVQI
jgi:drug/metabolite transporter (DMT)-like permease